MVKAPDGSLPGRFTSCETGCHGCCRLSRAGQRAGCEAAVHTMREIFADEGTEGILLVDASNAFNSLNCRAALLNIFHLPLETILTNTYPSTFHLFIDGS